VQSLIKFYALTTEHLASYGLGCQTHRFATVQLLRVTVSDRVVLSCLTNRKYRRRVIRSWSDVLYGGV